MITVSDYTNPKINRVFFIILGVTLLIVGITSFYFVKTIRLQGDECVYYRNSSIIANFILKNSKHNFEDVVNIVIGNGWFVPGMSLLLTPINLLFGGKAPIYAVRSYIIIINLILQFFISKEILKFNISRRIAFFYIITTSAVPYFIFFLGMIWGDLFAALLVLYFLLKLENLINEKRRILSKEYLLIGFLLGTISMVRPQYIMLNILIVIRFIFDFIQDIKVSMKSRMIFFFKRCSIVLISMLINLPWIIAVNNAFGPTFIITSIQEGPLYFCNSYVKKAREETGTNNRFHAVHSKLLKDSKKNGITLSEQATIEKESLDFNSTKNKAFISKSIYQFYFHHNSFLKDRFLSNISINDFLKSSLLTLNSISWFIVLSFGVISFIMPTIPIEKNYLIPLMLKGCLFLLTVHPFTGMAHGRYYVATIPFFALSFLLLLEQRESLKWREFCIDDIRLYKIFILLGQVFAFVFFIINAYFLFFSI